MLNENYDNTAEICQIRPLGIPQDLGDAIINLSSEGLWEPVHLQILLDYMKKRLKKSKGGGRLDGPFILPHERKFLVKFVSALEGNLHSFGIVCDHLLYRNESVLCSVLVGLVTGKHHFDEVDEEDDEEIVKLETKKYEYEVSRYGGFFLRDLSFFCRIFDIIMGKVVGANNEDFGRFNVGGGLVYFF